MIILIDKSLSAVLKSIIDKSHKVVEYDIHDIPIMPYDSSTVSVVSQWVYSKVVDNDADLVIVKDRLIQNYLLKNDITVISLT